VLEVSSERLVFTRSTHPPHNKAAVAKEPVVTRASFSLFGDKPIWYVLPASVPRKPQCAFVV
jgi:hypothetical protein